MLRGMGAVGWLITHRLRARVPGLLVVVVIVALGATGTLVAAGAADRTADAYPEYLDRARVGDVVINPSLLTTDIDRVIRDLPGVRAVATDALFFVSIDEGDPRPIAELDDDGSGEVGEIRGSVDGRYSSADRPAVIEGRLPTGRNEALVDERLAESHDLAVGDVLPVALWARADDLQIEDRSTVVHNLGVEHPRIVGIGTLPDEVLPDDLYQRQRVVLSADITDRYDCLPEPVTPDAAEEELVPTLAPAGCATSYQYYSLALDGGDAGVDRALEAFNGEAQRLTAGLPPVLQEIGAAYIPITTRTADEERRVERATQPVTVALGVLAGAAALATVLVAGLAIARELRRTEPDQVMWWRAGTTRGERVLAGGVPVLAAVLLGLLVALPLAWLLSTVAPVGIVRAVDPSPAHELAQWAWLAAAGLLVVLVVLVGVLSFRTAGRVTERLAVHRLSVVGRLLRGTNRPVLDEGIRGAFAGNRGAGIVVATGGLAAGLLLVAVVFATSLSHVLATPASYGWPWDVGAMLGYGYGGVNSELVDDTLSGHDEVERWTGLGVTNSVTLNEKPIVSMLGFDETSSVDLALVDGRLPTGDAEVAIGARTADEEELSIGDEVEIAGYEVGEGVHQARVTGVVVVPPLGPFQADRASPGRGLLVPEGMVDKEVTTIPGGGTAISFIGLDLRDGADPDAVLADLRDDMKRWDVNGYSPFEYPDPVRPAEIIDARAMRSAPTVVAGLLVGSATVALSAAVVLSVRSRRRHLAVLRSVGFTAGQVRASVGAQSLVTMAVALVVGVPLGVAAGRIAWRAFADQLGVLTSPSTPVLWLVATVLGGVVIAVLAAAVPARLATGLEPAPALRGE
jgi:hypothetical protein